MAVLGVLVIAGGIGFTTTPEALVSASMIGGVAFGLPAIAVYALAHWLDYEADSLQHGRDRLVRTAQDYGSNAPFREPVWGYVIAIACALGAWALRMAVDRVLPGNVPFITFFLAVAVAGWLGGFGPAVLATILSAIVARYFYMAPVHTFHLHELPTAAALGIFVFTSLVIGALTSMLHAALRRIQFLSNRLDALGAPAVATDQATSGDRARDEGDEGQGTMSAPS